MSANDVVGSTAEPALAVDRSGKVIAWNRAIERRMGHRWATVAGRPCWEVLAGRDLYGNRYCTQSCPLLQMAMQRQSVRHCQLSFRDASGKRSAFSVCTLTFPEGRTSEIALVHILSEMAGRAEGKEAPWRRRPERKLTPREIEVLELISQDLSTTEIAEQLSISVHTVRNHIQRALSKLRVHSRLEAVGRARRRGVID